MNQSQFLAIICNSLKAREKSCLHSAISFGFTSHSVKNWRESFMPITKRSDRNHVISFGSHLKTALYRAGSSADRLLGTTRSIMQHSFRSFLNNGESIIGKFKLNFIKFQVYYDSSHVNRPFRLVHFVFPFQTT